MAQADYVVANGTGAAVRSDLNGQLAAIVSNNSGATEPATMYAYQWWADTTTNLLKLRNSANSAWITIGTLADANLGLLSLAGGTLTGALLADDSGTAALPAIAFDGDTNTGIFRAGADQLGIATNGVERVEFGTSEVVFNDGGANYDFRIEGDTNTSLFFVDASAEAVGIGTTSVDELLHLQGASADDTTLKIESTITASERSAIEFFNGSVSRGRVSGSNDFDGLTLDSSTTESAAVIRFRTGGASLTTKMTLTSGGSLGIGTSSPSQLLHLSSSGPRILLTHTSDNSDSFLDAGSSGVLEFSADDNSVAASSSIRFKVDGSERARIDSSGRLLVGKTTSSVGNIGAELRTGDTNYAVVSTSDGHTSMLVGRNTNDGTLVQFRQANSDEGSISVSGSTVSYNGAHLSRWSQLTSGAERIEILRGSVLSNLDEMCEWGEEENEQLNRMKVSDVEGDKNVSGVFQCWDDDDDTYTNDFYCAMTGDFIIRLAEGVTVERGDLLMSAGDGTAKPQDDDIIRSKTIAKVTSTHVTCTYDDSSYCVPCVLMAC